MPPTSDKKPRTHNKIPSDPANSDERDIDETGWEEAAFHLGLNNSDTYYPHIRYGFKESGNIIQGELQQLKEPIPEDAVTASTGVYFLTAREKYLISQGAIEKSIQERCENEGRVAYSIVAESDALEKGIAAQTIIRWLVDLSEGVLDIDNSEYQLFFSGGRSIHLHTDYYVSHGELKSLRDDVQDFNQNTDAELDVSLYTPKSQFRLIGAYHRTKKMFKTPIQKDADNTDIIKNSHTAHQLSLPHSIPHKREENNLVAGNGDRSSLPQEYESRLLRGYIKEANPDGTMVPDPNLSTSQSILG